LISLQIYELIAGGSIVVLFVVRYDVVDVKIFPRGALFYDDIAQQAR